MEVCLPETWETDGAEPLTEGIGFAMQLRAGSRRLRRIVWMGPMLVRTSCRICGLRSQRRRRGLREGIDGGKGGRLRGRRDRADNVAWRAQ